MLAGRFDALAFRYLHHAIRYRLYSSWGLSASEIATIVAFNGITFWIGFLLLTGAAS